MIVGTSGCNDLKYYGSYSEFMNQCNFRDLILMRLLKFCHARVRLAYSTKQIQYYVDRVLRQRKS